MLITNKIILLIPLLWIAIYTISFARWTWKRKNKLGAAMIFLVALATVVLSMYTLLIREG